MTPFDRTHMTSFTKVIDLGVTGKPICDFLLVINCNFRFSRICYRYRRHSRWKI